MANIRVPGKLRNKIFVMMVMMSVLPLVLSAILSIYSITTSHRIDVANIETSLLKQKSGEIKSFIGSISDVLQLQVGFEQTTDIELSAQKFLLKQLLKDNPALQEVAFLSFSGIETSRFSRDYPDGVSSDELRDEAKIQKFVDAKAGKNHVGSIHFTLNGPAITLSSPVVNKNGAIISVLTAEVNLSHVGQLVSEATLGNTGYLYLVDENGFLVASTFTGQAPLNTFKGLGIVNDLLQGKEFLGVDGERRYNSFFGEEVVAEGITLPSLHGALVAEWPVREADAIVNTLIYRNVVISIFVLLAVLLVSALLANFIVRPIKMLEEGTSLVAQGKFDKPVDIQTGDELEELGTYFNKMMSGLKQLQELKDEFVFIAAHELRTPVTAIKGYLSMVLDGDAGPVTDSVKEFLHKVIDANQRLIQLVNDLLQVARSEAGRLEVKVVPTDISGAVSLVLSELQPLANEKSIKIVYDPDKSLPQAMADAQRLKEVMVNLVGNAIKYTVGSGTVTITHEVKNNELVTHVKDVGVGISLEAQKNLFEKFYRVQTEKTKDITGTGLGLFIVKQIVEKMNGKIWVESEEGKGSTFSFSLPLA